MRCIHTEKTRCFPASWSDRRHRPTNKSKVMKRQDAERGIRSEATLCSGLPGEETCRECGSRCSHTEKERDGPGLI